MKQGANAKEFRKWARKRSTLPAEGPRLGCFINSRVPRSLGIKFGEKARSPLVRDDLAEATVSASGSVEKHGTEK